MLPQIPAALLSAQNLLWKLKHNYTVLIPQCHLHTLEFTKLLNALYILPSTSQ